MGELVDFEAWFEVSGIGMGTSSEGKSSGGCLRIGGGITGDDWGGTADIVYDRSLLFLLDAKRTLFGLALCCIRRFEAVRGVRGTSDSSASASESVEAAEGGFDDERPWLRVDDVDIDDCDGRRRDDGGL